MSDRTSAWESGLPPDVGGTVVTVGSFDGVHRGHVAVLDEIARRAAVRNLHSVLVTFDRHPLTVVRPEVAPGLLTTPDEKKEILSQSGLDYVAFLPFNRALSRYGPEEFVSQVLKRRFRVAELVIGYDHGFGRDEQGTSTCSGASAGSGTSRWTWFRPSSREDLPCPRPAFGRTWPMEPSREPRATSDVRTHSAGRS